MKNFISIAVLILAYCLGRMSAGQSINAWNPSAAGVAVSTTITFGDEYTTPIEIYDARISVTEVVRGERAWHLLSKESASNRRPDPAFEYVVARIRFEFAARGKPGDKSYSLTENQFLAFSSDGSTQYPPANAVPPNPRLGRTLHSSDSSEGWVAFLVARDDREPVLVFHSDVRVLSHSGTGPAFRLY